MKTKLNGASKQVCNIKCNRQQVDECCGAPRRIDAEKTNVGMTVFIADITSMCDFGSDGVAALLSACSFVRCYSHQFVFSCLEVLF